MVADSEPWYTDGFGWGLTGVGVLAAASSGYLLLDAADLEDQANTEDRQDVRDQLRDKASGRRLAGTIVGVVGVGLLVTGVIKLVVHSSPKRERVTTSWGVGFTGSGVQVFGSF